MAKQTIKRVRGRKLQTRRAHYFRAYPLCIKCQEQDKVTLATELDHIVALHKGGSDEPDNWQPLCTECHKVKTAIDMGYKPRVAIGLDGYPIA
jgi:5-methylcytosine-specific restriction endonuclease McrA